MQDFTQPNSANNQMPINNAVPGNSGVPPMPAAPVTQPQSIPATEMPSVQSTIQSPVQTQLEQPVQPEMQPISQPVEQMPVQPSINQPVANAQTVIQQPIQPEVQQVAQPQTQMVPPAPAAQQPVQPEVQQVVQPQTQMVPPVPVAQQPVQASAQQAPQAEKNQGSGKPAILVVEDEKDALDLYMYSIQSTGDFDVYGAMDGDEALMQLTQNKVDLVLLDIMMPKKDGVETLAELKKGAQMYGTPKIVMLTNIGGDIAIDKAMSLGADGYMLKSEIEPMELIGIIKQYLNIA